MNTDLVYQLLFISHGAKRSHEPTVAVTPLAYIRSGRPINIELRLFKNLLKSRMAC